MESTNSSTAAAHRPHLPPGFRFHPTDEELMVHYLKKKAAATPLPVSIIADIDIYKYDPWELPEKAIFGEQEWYFFTPRDRKYPNGARPNRAATSGYWKATGTDKPVLASSGAQKVGVKKALVFYGGKPPKGIKTNWIMHEYRLPDQRSSSKPPGCDYGSKKGSSLRLDDWVLCRIYKKSNAQIRAATDQDKKVDEITASILPYSIPVGQDHPISSLTSIPQLDNLDYLLPAAQRPSLVNPTYWNNKESAGDENSASTNRLFLQADHQNWLGGITSTTNLAARMMPMQQQQSSTPSLGQQTMLGNVDEEGLYAVQQGYDHHQQVLGLNWYS